MNKDIDFAEDQTCRRLGGKKQEEQEDEVEISSRDNLEHSTTPA